MNYKIIGEFQGFRLEIEDNKEVEDLNVIFDKFLEFVEIFKGKFDINKSIHIDEKNNEIEKKSSILITDSSEAIRNIKIQASNLFKFTNDGDVIRKISLDKLTVIEQIVLISLEKKMLFEESLSDNEIISLDDLDDELALNKNQITARVSDLTKSNILKRTGRGEYKLNIHAIDEFLKSLNQKLDE